MTPSDSQQLLHRQFAEQARRTPMAVGLYAGDQSVTYADLERRANAIAQALRVEGVRRGSVVGLHVERSIAWVAAVLGILKTNAAVLPLPPSYPVGRLQEILTHAALDAVIDDDATPLDPALPARRLNLGTLSSSADVPQTEDEHADQTAFVLCSSGSTGTPKMIARSHRSFQHRLHWTWERHPYATGEVCCQKAHATTTHGIYELFEPLLRGVPVVVIGDEDARHLEVFWDIVRSRGVTRLLLVPSALHSTLDMPGFVPPSLRVVVLMGEYVSPELAARAVAAFPPSTHLYSIYGSTEASSTLVCDLRASLRPGQELPLGTPISEDVRAHVLGPGLTPVGPGEVGTLYMSGTPLFTEYFRSPELTAAVIVTGSQHAERLYDTHDHVRSMPDGGLEFVGRVDNMVKIRGFRVDPQDVERALVSHPDVRRAAVVVRGGGSGHATLMAFVTPAEVDSASVFRTLRARLPPYMIPSAVVGVERFPLTASGKLDRRRLLEDYAMHAVRPAAGRPMTATERRIAEIWTQILGHVDFGLDTSFFEAGGSSLTVFALVHQLRETFALDRGRLPEQSVYRFPTIETLAGYVEEILEGRSSTEMGSTPILVTLRQGRSTTHPPIFLVASAGGTLGAYARLAKALETPREIIGVRDPFVWGERDPSEGFGRWIDRYVGAIRARQPHGPYAVCAYSSAGAFGYETARRLRESGEDVEILVLVDPLALDRRSRRRYGWWALRATWARPSVRRLIRLAGWLRTPLGFLPWRASPRTANGLSPSREEFARLAAATKRNKEHLRAFAALLELNTGLPLALDDADFADMPADDFLKVLEARVTGVMPDVDPASIERIVVQYELQVRSQHAYMLQPYDGRVLLLEPATRYAGLLEPLLRPYTKKLQARAIALGEPTARTRELTAQFGPLASHYRSMRDDQFVEGIARAIDDVLR